MNARRWGISWVLGFGLQVILAASVPVGADDKLKFILPITPSPPLAIPLTGGKGEVEVFFTDKRETSKRQEIGVTVTSAGPLRGSQVAIANTELEGAVQSRRIVVVATVRLKVGESHQGALIFQSGDEVDHIPFTVTETGPASFSLHPASYDICAGDCTNPATFDIQVTNTGSNRISHLKVFSITLEDVANHSRVVYPVEIEQTGQPALATDKGSVQEKYAQEETVVLGADVIEIKPGEARDVGIAPGGSRTIRLKLALPWGAGVYTGTVQVAANDGEPKAVQLTLRNRGPQLNGLPPWVVFLAVILCGTLASRTLEHFYGSGGGLARARSLLSLDSSRAILADMDKWLNALPEEIRTKLPKMTLSIYQDIADIDVILRTASNNTVAEIGGMALDIATRVAKRRMLQLAVTYAQKEPATMVETTRHLDRVSSEGDATVYRDALNKVLQPSDVPESASPPKPSIPKLRDRAEFVLKYLPCLRYLVWMIVIVGTGYSMFYASRCSFGTMVDYITVFFWSLGLTQAGSAVLSEGRSSYSLPVRS